MEITARPRFYRLCLVALFLVAGCTDPRRPEPPVVERPPAIGEIVAMLRPSKDVNAVLVRIMRDPGEQELLVYDVDNGRLAGRLRRVSRRQDVLHCEVATWGEKGAMLRVGAPVYPSSTGDYPAVEPSAPPVRHEPGHDRTASRPPRRQDAELVDPAMPLAAERAAERAAAFRAEQTQQNEEDEPDEDMPEDAPSNEQ